MIKIYKDDFKRFLVCPKWMWLMKFRKQTGVRQWAKQHLNFLHNQFGIDFYSEFEFNSDQTTNPITDNVGMRIMSGIWFEELVYKHIKNQHQLYTFLRHDPKSNESTKAKLSNPQYNAFSQPWFRYQNYITQCDFLIKNHDGFDLYEVKGVSQTNTAKKRGEYFADLLYQFWILTHCGIKVKNVFLVHLNRNYHRDEKLDLNQLIMINKKFNTQYLKTLDISNWLSKVEKYLQQNFLSIQPILNSLECNETKRYADVDYKTTSSGFCNEIVPNLPHKHHILHLYRMLNKNKVFLYWWINHHQKPEWLNLERFDLKQLSKIPESIVGKKHHFRFSLLQDRQIRVIQKKEPIVQNPQIVINQLTQYRFPIYFYDFETCPMAIPQFNASQPYLQIPFQFSVHILEHLDQGITTIKNVAFLTTERTDPRLQFTKTFIKTLQKYGPGSYVAYHKAFECNILYNLLNCLQDKLTDSEKQILEEIINNTLDVKDFFTNFNVYLPNFNGSLSIKKTLPAFASDFGYHDLRFQKGDQASAAYFNYIYQKITEQGWKELRPDLLKYCALDTLAMVVLWQKIYKLVKN